MLRYFAILMSEYSRGVIDELEKFSNDPLTHDIVS